MRRLLVPQIATVALTVVLAGCPDPTEGCQTNADCVAGAYCHQEYLVCFTGGGADAGPIEQDAGANDAGVDAGSTAPNAPTGLTATAADGRVDLSWTGGSEPDLARYNLYLGTAADALVPAATVAAPETSYSVTGLVNGTRYFFAVEAENTAGQKSTRSSVVQAIPSSEDISQPTIIRTTPSDGATDVLIGTPIEVEFSEPIERDSLNVQISSGASLGNAVWSKGDTSVSFDVGTAAYSSTYFVAVTARDLAGNGLGGGGTFSFSTEDAPDTTRPNIVGNAPSNGATGVSTTSTIAFTFSEPMLKASVEAAFGISPVVPGSLAWDASSTVLTFVSSSPLAYATQYVVTMRTGAKDLAGNSVAADRGFSFTTAAAPDTTRPVVSSSTPPNGATNVSVTPTISVTFSEPMDAATEAAFVISPSVSGSAVLDSSRRVLIFSLSSGSSLSYATQYAVAISTGASDIAGNHLAQAYSFSFNTRAPPDTTAPRVTTWVPANSSTGVSVDQRVTIAFSESMDVSSVQVAVSQGYQLGLPSWNSPQNTSVTFAVPDTDFAHDQAYTVSVSGRDPAGNSLAGTTSVSFRTANPPDTIAPTVLSNLPANGSTGIARTSSVSITFSEAMNLATVEPSFAISPSVFGSFLWDGSSTLLSFSPSTPLAYSTQYTVTVSTGGRDVAGNPLAAAHSFSFTTGAEPDLTPPTVTGSNPAHNAVGGSRTSNIKVVFSEPMNKVSAQAAFAITSPTGFNAGSFGWNTAGTEMTFNPDGVFPYGAFVTFRVSTVALDAAGNPLTADVTRTFRAIQQRTVDLYSVGSLDGIVSNAGHAQSIVGPEFSAGREPGASGGVVALRLFYGFDLNSLVPAPTTINSASLHLYQDSLWGVDPFAEIGPLKVDSVSYGSTLTDSAFGTSVNRGCTPTPCLSVAQSTTFPAGAGARSTDVTTMVRVDWVRTSNGKRSQMRLYFAQDTDASKPDLSVAVYTMGEHQTNKPFLRITYEHP